MPARKRPADDTLLPLRAPKQPKRTANHPLGGNSSPTQGEVLFARWCAVSMDVMHLLKDTLLSVVGGEYPVLKDGVERCSSTCHYKVGRDAATSLPVSASSNRLPAENGDASGPIPSPPPSPPPPPPPRASTSAHRLPPRLPIPAFPVDANASSHRTQLSTSAPAAAGIHRRIQSSQPNADISQPPVHPNHARSRPNAVASTSKTTLPAREDPKVSGFPGGPQSTGLMSPPSTQASESSIYSVVTRQYPEVGAALQQAAPRRKKSTKKYIERPHILAKEVSRIYCVLRHSADASASTKPGCRRRTRS